MKKHGLKDIRNGKMGHFSNLNKDNKELKIYRPFGPSIGHCKLPQELIDEITIFRRHVTHLIVSGGIPHKNTL